MATKCSSSYCAQCSQPKFKSILCTWQLVWIQVYTHDERGKKRAMIQCITSKVMFCYVCFKYIYMFIDRKYELLDQFYIFHNLNQFMLLDLIANLRVVISFVIFYNNQINECFCYSNKENFVIKKIIIRFSLLPAYTLFTNYELGYLLHVHECIDNFESSLFPYINDFFCFKFLLY